MIIDGEKWACDSCVKGHRVSNCNHAERPLNHIAPKGRPVKQCEHCRDARKSKSHHAKCDCGSKRKDKKQSESKSEDRGCCCHKGKNCVCSNKSEMQGLRLETSLGRPTYAVKSKPKLTSSNSETTLTVFTNGHHKPVHRNNNLAHTSGAPYKIPRPHTLHGTSAFAQATRGSSAADDLFGRSADDLLLLNSNSSSKLYGSLTNAQSSTDSLHMPTAAREITSFDVENLLANTSQSTSENVGSEDLSNPANMSWFDTNPLTSVAEAPAPVDFSSTSPNFSTMPEFDWNIPSATTDFFSPADLPLVSNPAFPDYAQPISNSGESSYQSAPGLTAPSSGTQSETGEPAVFPDPSGFWSDNLAFRDASEPYRMYNDLFTPSNGVDLDAKAKPSPNLFNFDSSVSQHHSHHLSDSTAVPDEPGSPQDAPTTGVNIGHLQNLATLQQSTESNKPLDFGTADSETRALIIPVGVDDDSYDSWTFPSLNAGLSNSDASREYSWLLDSA